MEFQYYFTVFIPVYNRAHTLNRLFDSLESQIFKNFEIIIVDDGSTDNTKEVVDNYLKRSSYDTRYFYQENKGKPSARNLAIDYAKGMLFKTIDSDDIVTNDCLQLMRNHWESIDEDVRDNYAGVIGLCADYNTKEIIGDKFPEDIFDSNHVINNSIYKIKGDKTQCIRTDLMKKNKFPIIGDDKFIPESMIWNRIGLNYKFRYINKVMKYVEYQKDGMTNNLLRIRIKNWRSIVAYYQEYINLIIDHYDIPFIYKIKGYINYIRFSLHGRVSIFQQIKFSKSKIMYILSFVFGILIWKIDNVNIKKGRSNIE